jgi:muramoyltetrapeptide carboxypeptidase
MYLAGEDIERAGALMEMFMNPEVRVIMAARGGYGSQRILSKLDPELIHSHPKIFVGYSDVTFILLYLLDHCGIVPFHGPMVVEMGDMSGDKEEGLFKALSQAEPLGKIPLRNPVWIKRGFAQGALVGGNLTVICSTLGTPWEIRTEGRILFLEDCGEKPYQIDRMLNQLQLAGKLAAANGLAFGDIVEKGNNGEVSTNPAYEKEVMEILKDITRDFPGPVLWGLPVGHGSYNITLPLGVEAILDAEQSTLTVSESAVKTK